MAAFVFNAVIVIAASCSRLTFHFASFHYFYIMTMTALINEINKLPLTEKELLVEETLMGIRKEKAHELESAVNEMYHEYKTNKELTAFTTLDAETFYEAK